jgi:hypothetical protein
MAKRKPKLQDENPRLAAIRTLLLAEMIVIEAKQDEHMSLGFGQVGAPPAALKALQKEMAQLAECKVALNALDRLGA